MADHKETGVSKSEISSPSWLDATFIQEALHHDDEKSTVSEVSVRPASASGDNFVSTIYRVRATLADGQERSLMVKVLPSGDMAQFAKDLDVFRIESLMLGYIIPKMEALVQAVAPDRYSPLTARCLHHGTHPTDFLVLEDLAPQGFKMADRHKGLGLRHCLLILRTLARFNAASVAFMEREPSVANGLVNPLKKKNDGFETFAVGGIEATAEACRTWPGFEEYALSLEAIKPNFMKTFAELREPKPETFNVIIHGDFWMNNMMFRYEDGEPVDVRLVDLQLSHKAPAAVELLHFLSFNPAEDVAKQHCDLLVREYHRALVETMDLLGVEPPSLGKILADMDSHGSYALFGTLTSLPFVKSRTVPDIDAMLARDPNALKPMYENPAVVRWLQRVLPEYKRKGLLPTV